MHLIKRRLLHDCNVGENQTHLLCQNLSNRLLRFQSMLLQEQQQGILQTGAVYNHVTA